SCRCSSFIGAPLVDLDALRHTCAPMMQRRPGLRHSDRVHQVPAPKVRIPSRPPENRGTFRRLIHLRLASSMAGASPAFRRENRGMNVNVRALGPVRPLLREGKPDRAEVEAAVRTLIRWSGDDPLRQGLLETPARVARALEEAFAGYAQEPAAILQKSFDETEGYDEMVVLRGVRFESHCEHHMSPIL